MRRLFVFAAMLFALPVHGVEMEWIEVGNPGNAPDTTGYGTVAGVYFISQDEVTNAQYAEFLNAVADTDTYGLYNTTMGSVSWNGGITRSGSPGDYSYSAIPGRESMPVNFVSFWDALRFANWLHNDQPVGAQGPATTEDGAYTITPGGIAANSITRNAGATIFLPSEDEWYKAAYYDAVSASYFAYPAGSDVATTCATPGATPNTANCNYAVNDVTDVGSYTGSASPSGTFDQGGNILEWSDTIIGSYRIQRGGGFDLLPDYLPASARGSQVPGAEQKGIGIRVASSFEPVPACEDGLDNDGDGFTDFVGGDPGCVGPDDLSENEPTLFCDDGEDNDFDGLFDTADPACSSGNPYVPDPMAPREDTQCQDGMNNDLGQDPNPGLIDFDGGQSRWGECTGFACVPPETWPDCGCPPAVSDPEEDGVANPDPQCVGRPWKNMERVPPNSCGLGTELAFLLPPLIWLRRRRSAH